MKLSMSMCVSLGLVLAHLGHAQQVPTVAPTLSPAPSVAQNGTASDTPSYFVDPELSNAPSTFSSFSEGPSVLSTTSFSPSAGATDSSSTASPSDAPTGSSIDSSFPSYEPSATSDPSSTSPAPFSSFVNTTSSPVDSTGQTESPMPTPSSVPVTVTETTESPVFNFTSGDDADVSSDASCSAYPKCGDLAGDCCPAAGGIDLYCCEKIPQTCASNSKCAQLNLKGACCPTPQGIYLDCCDADWADASAHPNCANETGRICPNGLGEFAACCTNDPAAQTLTFESEIAKTRAPFSDSAAPVRSVMLVGGFFVAALFVM